jgi:serine phosphatase RsbU (regulator of sigma subunit)
MQRSALPDGLPEIAGLDLAVRYLPATEGPAAGELSYASAGHLPPILTTRAGHAEYLDTAAGVMLGVPGETVFTTGRRHLARGDTLLFCTDGLIEERHRDIADGLDALAAVMRTSTALSAEQSCGTAQVMLPGGAPRADDVCLLAARLR